MTFKSVVGLILGALLLSEMATAAYSRQYSRRFRQYSGYSRNWGYSRQYRDNRYSRSFRTGGYAPRDFQELSEVEADFLNASKCEWVANTENDSPAIEAVAAYPVIGCNDGDEPPVVCAGTIRCNTTMGDAKFTYYVENAMCVSQNPGCPFAQKCLLDGGALADMKVQDLVGIPSGGKKIHEQNAEPVNHYDR